VISELNSQACTPPVNASPPPYGKPTHDSGPRLVAIHYHAGDFHPLLFAGFYRRFRFDPFSFSDIVFLLTEVIWELKLTESVLLMSF